MTFSSVCVSSTKQQISRSLRWCRRRSDPIKNFGRRVLGLVHTSMLQGLACHMAPFPPRLAWYSDVLYLVETPSPKHALIRPKCSPRSGQGVFWGPRLDIFKYIRVSDQSWMGNGAIWYASSRRRERIAMWHLSSGNMAVRTSSSTRPSKLLSDHSGTYTVTTTRSSPRSAESSRLLVKAWTSDSASGNHELFWLLCALATE